ncbi:MAG: posphoenolpyruvate synthetase regulatory kinase/phosphorylase PpsR [Panacagrimonas sp.]
MQKPDTRYMPTKTPPTRPVFFLSDGTGITAETLGNTLLTQFDGVTFKKSTLPFINTVEKARNTIEYIDYLGSTGPRPMVFSTTVNEEVRAVLRTCTGMFVDLFDTYIPAIEEELGQKSTHTQGRAHGLGDKRRYDARIAAMNFAMEHDDGQSTRDLPNAQVILIAPSRCGKTPTTLYLALQHGIFASNFPITEDDLEAQKLPKSLDGLVDRCFGLTSDAERLHQVRTERRPGSKYASLAQCSFELREAERLYQRCNIPFVSSATRSIEEIAAVVIQEKELVR